MNYSKIVSGIRSRLFAYPPEKTAKAERVLEKSVLRKIKQQQKPYKISTKPGFPVHPLINHLNSLPEIPGKTRSFWGGYVKETLAPALHALGISLGELPSIGAPIIHAVSVSLSVRISWTAAKDPSGKRLYAVEHFKV